jgi:mono/diheme cytochrome c family protein
MPAYSGEEANARGSAPGDARRGARAFAAYCAHCHGEDGRGGPTVGSIVDRAYLALTSDQALRTAVVIGRDDEGTRDRRDDAARRAMSDQEIADIVAWIASHRAAE